MVYGGGDRSAAAEFKTAREQKMNPRIKPSQLCPILLSALHKGWAPSVIYLNKTMTLKFSPLKV
ncbi:MAG: hypothetical protein WCG27_01955 [Pseudomonadota bacterium]